VIGSATLAWGRPAPGLVAAGLCLANMLFAWRYLPESRTHTVLDPAVRMSRPREAVWRVLSHSGEPAPRLIWIYAIAMGAFQAMTSVLALLLAHRHGVTERTIGFFFMYIGATGVIARAGLLGPLVKRLGEPRLSRLGILLLATGLATLPLARSYVALALVVPLVPLGTAFTFPCITAILTRVIAAHERGLYMGVQQTFGGVARVVGPIGAGWAYDHLGPGVPFWTGAVVVLGTLALGAGMEEYIRPKPEPVAVPT
jgi:predicted MFS family arabinose efflux permease